VSETPNSAVGVPCKQCRQALAAEALFCPHCQQLVHASTLRDLAQRADMAERAGDLSGALNLWRQALALLPEHATQYAAIQAKVTALSAQFHGDAPVLRESKPVASSSFASRFGLLGVILIFAVTKGKFLLMGLSKLSTVLTFLLTFGLYWSLWGWQFALGLLLCIYIHEMGHVAALQKCGIPASAPMFIPGFGAIVRLKQYPATPREDAYVGLAGPIYGLGAAIATYLIFLATQAPLFAALTHVGALINVFNLTPIAGLDGDRGFRSLTIGQRWLAMLSVGVAFYLTGDGILIIVLLFGALRLLPGGGAEKPDVRTLAKYVLLVAALMWLSVETATVTPFTPLPGPAAGAPPTP